MTINIISQSFIQNLWNKNIDWDSELSVHDRFTWENLQVKLNKISSVKISCLVDVDLNVNGNLELHFFVDASNTQKAKLW